MKTTFTARHFEPSTDLRTYAEDSLQKMDQFYDRIITCDIILEPLADDENPFQAEVNMRVPQKVINAKEQSDSYELAINEVVENAIRQLKKYKKKTLHQR